MNALTGLKNASLKTFLSPPAGKPMAKTPLEDSPSASQKSAALSKAGDFKRCEKIFHNKNDLLTVLVKYVSETPMCTTEKRQQSPGQMTILSTMEKVVHIGVLPHIPFTSQEEEKTPKGTVMLLMNLKIEVNKLKQFGSTDGLAVLFHKKQDRLYEIVKVVAGGSLSRQLKECDEGAIGRINFGIGACRKWVMTETDAKLGGADKIICDVLTFGAMYYQPLVKLRDEAILFVTDLREYVATAKKEHARIPQLA